MPKFDERFARQYRYELPPGFPLASPNSGIGHHLSGLNKYAQARTSRVGRCCIDIHSFRFHCAYEFNTLTLAHLFNSLVRVSRRVVYTCHSRQLTASRFASLLHWKNSSIEQVQKVSNSWEVMSSCWSVTKDRNLQNQLHLGHGQSLPPWRFQVF